MTKNLTETNELLLDYRNQGEMFYSENHFQPKTNQSRRWKHTKPDLMVNCAFCAKQFIIKYILPRRQYSQKNNWGYWTGKKVFANKYVCDNCLVNIHKGGIINWVSEKVKADTFYTYLSRKTFNKK